MNKENGLVNILQSDLLDNSEIESAGTMNVSTFGVPLLMVNGNFRNLSTLSVEELESFIPFMTGFSISRGHAKMVNGVPEWWIKTIPYKFPLKKPTGLNELGYKRHLQSVVCKCYCYHNAHFLLSFSSKFSRYPLSIFLRNNEDNTTTVFSIQNTAEIFTFDNENKDYDSKLKKEKPYWRTLLPVQQNKTQAKTIIDIYLCENCDVEFSDQTDMQRHEKECYGTSLEDLSNEIEIITHIKNPKPAPSDPNNFMNYLGLCSKTNMEQNTPSSLKEVTVKAPVKRWVILNMCLYKNPRIEFSSMLGMKMLEHQAKRDVVTRLEKTMLTIESFCREASDRTFQRESKKLKVTYKKSKKGDWEHIYCFTKKQRMEKLSNCKTGLSERSRRLLDQCKNVRICLQRLKLPPEADYFVVSFIRRLIIPYAKKPIRNV